MAGEKEVEGGEVSEKSRPLETGQAQARRLFGRGRRGRFGGQPGPGMGDSVGTARNEADNCAIAASRESKNRNPGQLG